ncbi:MAG: Ig-like domain repeat protein, partial [Bacteroidales bacterium]|nr:Ig-like domain repeat protein [Bacteroidales bacterium]
MINGGAYNTIQLNKQNYYIPWRSVEAGKSAFVVAEMAITSDTITTKNIEFVDANGLILSTSPAVGKAGSKSTFLKINLQAGNHQDVNRITAQYFRTDKDGKKHTTPLAYVNVISYNSQPVDLVIATTTGNTPNISASELQTELNHIYSQSVIQFKVSQIDLGTVDFDKNKDNRVDAGETGIISNYTAETRAFKRAVRKHQAYNKKHFYIVMVPQAEKTDGRASLQGRWALKTQVGFVFNPSSMSRTDFIRTVAHESGHGIFRLWHTFSANSKYIIPQGTTNNLMDYPSVTLSGDEGTDLYKHQWDFCHDPESMTGLFQDDSEGGLITYDCFAKADNYKKFMGLWEKLKKNPRFKRVYEIVEKSTKTTYCFSELEKGMYNETNPPFGYATHLVYDTDAFRIWFVNHQTNKSVNIEEYYNLIQNISQPSNEWEGKIGVDISRINKTTIFHELNHAAQNILEMENGISYSDVQMEVETRLILYYDVFITAPDAIRKDYRKMYDYLINKLGKDNCGDLMPLTGYFTCNRKLWPMKNAEFINYNYDK